MREKEATISFERLNNTESYDDHFKLFVEMIEKNRENELIRNLVYYFLIIDGIIDINNSYYNKKNELLLINRCFIDIMNGNIDVDEYAINDFIDKCSHRYIKNHIKQYVIEELKSEMGKFQEIIEIEFNKGNIKNRDDLFEVLIKLRGE